MSTSPVLPPLPLLNGSISKKFGQDSQSPRINGFERPWLHSKDQSVKVFSPWLMDEGRQSSAVVGPSPAATHRPGRRNYMSEESASLNRSMSARLYKPEHHSKTTSPIRQRLHNQRGSALSIEPVQVPQRIISGPRSTERQSLDKLVSEANTGHPVRLLTSDARTHKELSKVHDFQTLALACRRAGKQREEGEAYLNLGIIYENTGNFLKAIMFYEKYLSIAVELKDSANEALALSNIGICHQLIGGEKHLDLAIEYHARHLEKADLHGKFVAHCNLGLCFSAQGEEEKASLNHRQALRYAILMADVAGEALACGNLGISGSRKGDDTTARACLERHLKLSDSLQDKKGSSDACCELGRMAMIQGDHQEASRYFETALMLAQDMGEERKEVELKCRIGIARGTLKLDELRQELNALIQDEINAET